MIDSSSSSSSSIQQRRPTMKPPLLLPSKTFRRNQQRGLFTLLLKPMFILKLIMVLCLVFLSFVSIQLVQKIESTTSSSSSSSSSLNSNNQEYHHAVSGEEKKVVSSQKHQTYVATTTTSTTYSRQKKENYNHHHHRHPSLVLDNKGEIKNFFYVHIPKAGTSLYILLRNRLMSCVVKNYTCFGVWGGGLWGYQSETGQDTFPYHPKVMGIVNQNPHDHHHVLNVDTCNKTLNCKIRKVQYHCPYTDINCRTKTNKVTMFRNPYKRWKSILDWNWAYYHRNETSLPSDPSQFVLKKTQIRFYSQLQFTAGTSDVTDVDHAFDKIIQKEFVWWGITDFWSTSVCLFHCELGGSTSPNELVNTRSSARMKNLSSIEEILPKQYHRSSYIPNITTYVNQIYPEDIKLYYSKVLPEFQRRVSVCGC